MAQTATKRENSSRPLIAATPSAVAGRKRKTTIDLDSPARPDHSSPPNSSQSQKRRKPAATPTPKSHLAKTSVMGRTPAVQESSRTKAAKAPAKVKAGLPAAPPEEKRRKRMFVLDRGSSGEGDAYQETFEMAGSTGNVYTITVGHVPSCTCPDHRVSGNQCKHIIYVLVNVLKAPAHLQYQAAFLTAELKDIFEHAPRSSTAQAETGERDGRRRPIEGECPICVLDLEPAHEEIVYCRASCGNNLHQECFRRWAASKRGAPVTCVYCRAPWQEDEAAMAKIAALGAKTREGYVNVASQLGLSGQRDISTYHAPWVRRKYGYGY
ncbi:MAG: hypothetical protein M1838_000115 [Thelocarpon superellum]|nr:MAG: hypothetical protein M1838_000115 [Thelocarpon superellum]